MFSKNTVHFKVIKTIYYECNSANRMQIDYFVLPISKLMQYRIFITKNLVKKKT